MVNVPSFISGASKLFLISIVRSVKPVCRFPELSFVSVAMRSSDDPERVQVRINATALSMSFDYSAPAELFLAKRTKNGRGNYWRFPTAAEARRFAVGGLRTPKAFGAWLEVGLQQHRNPAAVRSR